MFRKSGPRVHPVAKSDITRARNALVGRILEGHGTAPRAWRRAAFENAGLAAPLSTLVDKVAKHAHRITDQRPNPEGNCQRCLNPFHDPRPAPKQTPYKRPCKLFP